MGMILFEATNGLQGCSYVRKYVWAESQTRAEELSGQGWKLEPLFTSLDSEFVTEASDEGFEKRARG